MITDELLKWKSANILDRLTKQDVPCARILDRWSLLEDEQVIENKMIEVHEHPTLGSVRQPRPAVRFDRTPAKVTSLAPYLGANNSEILSEAGYLKDEIEQFETDNILFSQDQ